MKKLIFSLSLFLSFSSVVHAQWTTNGTVTSTTNSIGIGTTTPDEKLVVNGNIKSVLESTNNPAKNVATIKQLGFSGATGAMNWALRGVYQYPNGVLSNANGGDLDIIKSWNGNTILGTKTDGTSLGNVGIGTQTPGLTNSAFKTLTMSGLNTRSVVEFQNTSAGTSGIVGSLEFYNGSTAIAGIDVGADGATNSGAYQFYTFNNGSLVPAVKILSNGNMGIGTTTTSEKLTVNGNVRIMPMADNTGLFAYDAATGGNSIFSLTRQSNNLSIAAFDGMGFSVAARSGASTNYSMFINTAGNVSIGTLDSKGYMLAVNGSTIATSVTVKAAGTWPDYVFKKDYQLPSLQEVKAYIDQNQHLPEIPSEQQIAKEGLNLGEMNKLLMKKVEELTLYMIAMKEEISSLKGQVQALKSK